QVNVEYASSEESSDVNETQTKPSSAREFYEKGRSEYLKFTPRGFENAIANYKKALEIDPNYAQAYAGLGEVHSFIGFYRYEVKDDYEEFYNESYQNMKKALQHGPNLKETQRALALNYLHLSREDDAEAAANRVLQMDPNDAESLYIVWAANGKNPDNPSIRNALRINPNLVMAHVDLGTAYFFKTGNYKKAAKHYKKAVELADSPQLHNYLGTTLRTQGYYPRAISKYMRAIQIDPNYAPAQMNLGITLYYMNKFNESIAREKKAIALNPNYPDSYFFLARSYEATNNPKLAIKNYKIFLDLASDQQNYSSYAATAKKNLSKLQRRSH
ncbi:MAG: tetratricopeptide repeat protein, partial [Thermodesulfobacteriota bacterium]